MDAKCICPTDCDCQNPPPDGWDGKEGCYHISNSCPVHNHNPNPHPDCPQHGYLSADDHSLFKYLKLI